MISTKAILTLMCTVALISISLSGCVSQSRYDEVSSTLEMTKADLVKIKAELDSANTKMYSLENSVQTKSEKIDGLLDSQAVLENDIQMLEKQIEDILYTPILQYYEFWFVTGEYSFTLPIRLGTYFHYKDATRPDKFIGYPFMATDDYDDQLIDMLIRSLEELPRIEIMGKISRINYLISYVQSLAYSQNSTTTPQYKYPQYPVETLFLKGGTCEDTSILTAAILETLGYDVVLLVFEEEQHVAIGVNVNMAVGYHFEYEGNKYFYIETTGKGWQVGQMPYEYRNKIATIYSVGQPFFQLQSLLSQ